MVCITADYEFGVSQEDKMLANLQDKFGKDLCKATSKTSPVDFYSDTVIVELKTRRNTYRKYPTTMISKSKIDFMMRQNTKKCYCVFKFTDGVYYIPINSDTVQKFSLGRGGRVDRGAPEFNIYYYIPINLLSKFPEDCAVILSET